ncbi:TRAP transporter substrate-binding protein [Cupriavidus sp. AcVe19-1a]|uniref:TRAP transporter substrate-binding protein n=1 Tax=Cupriavidus sp. AcVe19-1a TaxID=2821359 RepID=UPI001AE4210B|nr:TRAP transporter substrate-binding protein [Cupriavidus sp. AcVe19-1a]MBP0630464.1 TRAP transporter substrate-binding protein [Cupriavidus sp. AcVe19-1a]
MLKNSAVLGLLTLLRSLRYRRKLARLACCFPLAGLATTAVADPLSAAKLDARIIHIADYRGYLQADHPVRRGMNKFSELVATRSGGRILVQAPSETMPGSPSSQIASLQAGDGRTPELMLQATIGLADVEKGFGLIDLPFTISNEKQANALLDGPFGATLLDRLASRNLIGLAWWENGFRHMTTSTIPILHADNLIGLRIRVIPSPLFVESFKEIGADPIPLPFSELHAALKSRSVAAQDNFYSQIVTGKLYEVQTYLSVTHHSYGAMTLIASKLFWDTLAPADQALLRDAAGEAGQYQRRLIREENAKVRADLEAEGMRINEMDPTELKKLSERARPVLARIARGYDASLINLYKVELDRIRMLH